MRHIAALAFLVGLVAGSLIPMCATYSVATEQVKTIDYDTFGKLDLQGRIKAFNEISPENQAELVKTHAKRWLEKNRNRLTAEQISVLEENIAFITPDIYRLPKRDEDVKRSKELEV